MVRREGQHLSRRRPDARTQWKRASYRTPAVCADSATVDTDSNVMICESGRHVAKRRLRRSGASMIPSGRGVGGAHAPLAETFDKRRGPDPFIAYGNTRDLVTGVEAVSSDGRIVKR